MKYVASVEKMVKILMNMTFKRLIWLISKCLRIDSKQKDIQINMKP